MKNFGKFSWQFRSIMALWLQTDPLVNVSLCGVFNKFCSDHNLWAAFYLIPYLFEIKWFPWIRRVRFLIGTTMYSIKLRLGDCCCPFGAVVPVEKLLTRLDSSSWKVGSSYLLIILFFILYIYVSQTQEELRDVAEFKMNYLRQYNGWLAAASSLKYSFTLLKVCHRVLKIQEHFSRQFSRIMRLSSQHPKCNTMPPVFLMLWISKYWLWISL